MRASINGPNCERGHCSQSTMGTGTGWTTSHQHQQRLKYILYGNKSKEQLCECVILYRIVCAKLTPFIFLCRLKINHTSLLRNMCLFLRTMLWKIVSSTPLRSTKSALFIISESHDSPSHSEHASHDLIGTRLSRINPNSATQASS
jgi:hypothetical protein